MKPFHTIAVPHRDILEGRLTMDIFAADLWETHLRRAPEEYSDAETFFRKTYPTRGLKNLLDVIEGRLLKGKRGDPVIHIQTPFGGGKTHTLIAMYHKANEWEAKTVVIVGSTLSGNDTIWGQIEKQLTGEINRLSGNVAPGREALREVIEKNQPVLILMDELLEYVVKAAGVKVQDSTLAAQTLAFMQELTELAGTLEKTCVAITLPSSMLEHYDTSAEKLYQQLEKIAGRVEKIYSPVQESEITKVIRKRLFSSINESESSKVILEFLDYAEKEEGILPAGKEPIEYRDRFKDSYPFMPEVVETLYHRWGSFPTFQRTRGVLRLLSLVLNSLKQSSRPYITLSDFDLEKNEIKRELIKNIGSEFDSIISADISNANSGSKKVDKSLGKSLHGIQLGTRTATAVFMYSFSGGYENGATVSEIKRSATTIDNPSSTVVEALEQLKAKLFFMQNQNEKFFFSNQPNLNRILLTRMENIKYTDLAQVEKELIIQQIPKSGSKQKVILWPGKPNDIPDNEELKLVIIPQSDYSSMKSILKTKGDSPRIYVNTIFFLYPSDAEKASFTDLLKTMIAYEQIKKDRTLNLTHEQRGDVEDSLRKLDLNHAIRKYYRVLGIPIQGFEMIKEIDLGIPTYGEDVGLVQDVYDKLRTEGEIIEKISPLVIRERYLRERDYLKVQQIYDSMMKTPGEVRYVNRNSVEESLVEGVKQGLFGLGDIKTNHDQKEMPICRFFKEEVSVVDPNYIIMADRICKAEQIGMEPIQNNTSHPATDMGPRVPIPDPGRQKINLSFDVPRGKISHIMGILNLLQQRFGSMHLTVTAQKGSISEDDYVNKIKEALKQIGVETE